MSSPSNKPDPSRRDFLIGGAALAAGAAVASCLPGVDGRWPPDGGSALCSWTEPRITDGTTPTNQTVVERYNYDIVTNPPAVGINDMGDHLRLTLEDVLTSLTGAPTVEAAWAGLLSGYFAARAQQKQETIGIKVNVLNAKVPTHREIVRELVLSLKDAGVQGADILVWDRRLDELEKAGYSESYIGCKVLGTLDAPQTQGQGAGYEQDSICIGSQRSKLSTIMTRQVDHLINFAVMKNHLASGFTGVLKNHYGTIDNPGDFHDRVEPGSGTVLEGRFEQAIPTINALPEVRGKTRLYLVDAAICVVKGDTDSAPDWLPRRLLASLDPVALDARGRTLRDEMVVASGAAVKPDPISQGWLEVCERVGLGKMAYVLDSEPLKKG